MHERRSHWTGVSEGKLISKPLAPRHHFCRRPTIHVGLIEYDVGSHMCWPGRQHLLLAHNQVRRAKCRQFKAVAVRNRVCGTRFHAVSAENAAVVVDVVNLGVALGAADAVFRRVLGRLDVNAVGRTIGRAKEAGYTLFQAIFVALQYVRSAVSGLNPRSAERTLAVGIVLNDRGLEHLREGDAHTLGNRRDILQH
jgi:hypothetical protein